MEYYLSVHVHATSYLPVWLILLSYILLVLYVESVFFLLRMQILIWARLTAIPQGIGHKLLSR